MRGRAVIPASVTADIKHRIKVINPYYTVIGNIYINNDKAYVVFPPYDDEIRFIGAVFLFAAFYV